jgi:hypothetical protein
LGFVELIPPGDWGLAELVPPILSEIFFAMRGVCAGNPAASISAFVKLQRDKPSSSGAMQIVEGFPAGRGKTDTTTGWGNEAPPEQK